MSSTKITSPAATPGEVTSNFGPVSIVFKDGVATVDELSDGLRAYLAASGYGIGGDDATQPTVPEPPDPRDYDKETVGTPLRDAAVDPEPEDFLPPTNAGDANPHGPLVVSPGIHAVTPGPIVPGTVGSADYQNEKETTAAELVLVDGEPVGKVMAGLNALARAEYEKTKATGKNAGLAQELAEGDEVDTSHLTPEERDLLGLESTDASELKGAALDEALTQAGLSTDGKADEKRARLRISQTAPEDLKGADLEQALREAGLTLTGSAEERRARVAEHRGA